MGRKKKEIRLKEPVRIREKKIAGGNISLYLDIYQKGLRKKETLKLYLVPEINAATKLQNANTRKLAEQIKAQRILDIQREGLVDWDKVKKSRMTLTKWMDDFVKYNAELSESSMKTKRNTHARIDQYLLHIGKPEFLLKDVDKEFCKGFITFLKTCTYNDGKKQLSTTTCRMFVNYFGSSLAKAVRDGLIEQNPFLLLEAKEKPQKRVAERCLPEGRRTRRHRLANHVYLYDERYVGHIQRARRPAQRHEDWQRDKGLRAGLQPRDTHEGLLHQGSGIVRRMEGNKVERTVRP